MCTGVYDNDDFEGDIVAIVAVSAVSVDLVVYVATVDVAFLAEQEKEQEHEEQDEEEEEDGQDNEVHDQVHDQEQEDQEQEKKVGRTRFVYSKQDR